MDLPTVPLDVVETGVFAGFEAQVMPVIADVVARRDVVRPELDLILQFVALTAVRVPEMRRGSVLLIEKLTGVPFEEALTHPDTWGRMLQWCADLELGWGPEALHNLLSNPGLRSAYPQLWHLLHIAVMQDAVLTQLAKRRWDLCLSPHQGPDFLCSDSPCSLIHAPRVVPYRTPGFDEAGTVVTFPLHRSAALVGTFGDDDRVVESDTAGVAWVNANTLGSLGRFLYSASEDFVWVGEGGRFQDAAGWSNFLAQARRGERPPSVPPEYFA